MNNNNEKTIAEDNKKHKRNLSSPATISISDYEGNVSTSGTERIIRTPRRSRGIFLSRRFKTSYKDRMAGAVSDDPSMSRMTNGMHVINGTPFFVNGTDSELEGYNRQSAMQLNHKNSISQIVESNDNEPGNYGFKLLFCCNIRLLRLTKLFIPLKNYIFTLYF